MRRLVAILVLGFPWALGGANWVKIHSGPFEVLTDANTRAAREVLVDLEEFRYALGYVVGDQDLTTQQPVRVLIFDNPKGWTLPAGLAEGRGCWAIGLTEKQEISPDVYVALTRLFLQTNTRRMPAGVEHGLIEFFGAVRVSGIEITSGSPPSTPDLDWARIHLLITDQQYSGKVRVLLSNLRNGVPEDVSYRNAFGRSLAEIEAAAKEHLSAGNFAPARLPNRPMSARDFEERPVSESDARLARADLLSGAQSAAEYDALIRAGAHVGEAQEGLGLMDLRAGKTEAARKRFAAAVDAGSSSARCYIEYAKLEPDRAKAEDALLKAAGINPKLDEPFALLAPLAIDPRQRVAYWKDAAERNPRNPAYWKALAHEYLDAHNYAEASKAFTAGEQAATDPKERREMAEARLGIEQQRLDYEAAEKKRAADEEQRELNRLKADARAEVHRLEAKYNQGSTADPSAAVPWWNGPQPPGKVQGMLKQVDCLGSQARLIVDSDERKTVKLLVADAAKVAISGPGQVSLGCGVQKPRRVVIQYFPKANSRLATTGEVAVIEFQ
jgi:hypothetical protein